jgi:transcription antitermination factor NusG
MTMSEPTRRPWHVLWTHSHCEKLVFDQLAAQGFRLFLPAIDTWSRPRGGRRLLRRAPLFPGYLFLNHALDHWSDVQVRKARGLVAILGDTWDRRAVVPSEQIEGIQKLVDSPLPALPYAYPPVGQRMRITTGPLEGLEGTLVRTHPRRGLLVLSVELLRRGAAVEIDCTHVTPA